MRISKFIINDDGRECVDCKKYFKWLDFYKSKNKPKGYRNECKSCSKRQTIEYKSKSRIVANVLDGFLY